MAPAPEHHECPARRITHKTPMSVVDVDSGEQLPMQGAAMEDDKLQLIALPSHFEVSGLVQTVRDLATVVDRAVSALATSSGNNTDTWRNAYREVFMQLVQ